MDFTSAVVMGIPLVLVIIGLVEMVKKLGVAGNLLIVVSMAIGLVFGIAYQYSLAPLFGFAAWFNAIVYGLSLGLVASGIYSAAKTITTSQG